MSSPVIIIDPSLITRKILEVSLRRLGFEGVCFTDGEAALHALAGHPHLSPALVVLELKLPGMDGLQMVRLLRSSARYDGTAIIVLTAHYSARNRLLARLAGADRSLAKPFVRQLFDNVVSALLGRDNQRSVRQAHSGGLNEQYTSKPVRPGPTGSYHLRGVQAYRSGR
jgi:DNA-binding response OmpR family regulator